MKWTSQKPTRSGFYYFQDGRLRSFSPMAVMIVQVAKYANRLGFNAQTLHQDATYEGQFSGDLDQFRAGWWAGPLPEPHE